MLNYTKRVRGEQPGGEINISHTVAKNRARFGKFLNKY